MTSKKAICSQLIPVRSEQTPYSDFLSLPLWQNGDPHHCRLKTAVSKNCASPLDGTAGEAFAAKADSLG